MKIYLKILFIISAFHMNFLLADETCLQSPPSPLTMKNMVLTKTILDATAMTLKERQKAFEKIVHDDSSAFMLSLKTDQKKPIDELLTKIKKSKSSLVAIEENDGAPLLLVNGLDNVEFPSEWIRPFHHLLDKKILSYFYKWDKWTSLEKNRDELTVTIKALLAKHPDKPLTIIGYSAGGVLTLLAMDTLYAEKLSAERIQFHTVAAPLYGYKAPPIAALGKLFVGSSTIDIGIGTDKKLTNKTFNQCAHWVTLNCEMDQHACNREGLNPQLGSIELENALPCGFAQTKKFDDESHASVLNRAFNEIVKNDEK